MSIKMVFFLASFLLSFANNIDDITLFDFESYCNSFTFTVLSALFAFVLFLHNILLVFVCARGVVFFSFYLYVVIDSFKPFLFM